jgi:hypothetical protein
LEKEALEGGQGGEDAEQTGDEEGSDGEFTVKDQILILEDRAVWIDSIDTEDSAIDEYSDIATLGNRR